jgi:hypothetical protein
VNWRKPFFIVLKPFLAILPHAPHFPGNKKPVESRCIIIWLSQEAGQSHRLSALVAYPEKLKFKAKPSIQIADIKIKAHGVPETHKLLLNVGAVRCESPRSFLIFPLFRGIL